MLDVSVFEKKMPFCLVVLFLNSTGFVLKERNIRLCQSLSNLIAHSNLLIKFSCILLTTASQRFYSSFNTI
jgi:hypothetical protein